ncbi:hemerythrin domain-containing protein [Kitasatospora sp. NBC_00315]|uniref:hemerythrin domain-containing protein n=1 Tax=Kitasatospora sp. NBC_00315 TaxID=2975963 RepID=UPI00324B34CE
MSNRADVVGELSADHRLVAELLTRIEATAPTGAEQAGPPPTGTAPTGAQDAAAGHGTASGPGPEALVALVEELSDLLLSHCTDEEEYLFPAVHEQVPDGGALVFTSLADHLAIGQYLTDLQGLVPGDPAFAPLLTGLSGAVHTHLGEEEERLFPAVRRAMAPALLTALGERLREARRATADRPTGSESGPGAESAAGPGPASGSGGPDGGAPEPGPAAPQPEAHHDRTAPDHDVSDRIAPDHDAPGTATPGG